MSRSVSRSLAKMLAGFPILRRGKNLWEQNQQNFNLPLSRAEKVLVGTHVILTHYADGRFPPSFADQQKVYETERGTWERPGQDEDVAREMNRRKPFWYHKHGADCLRHFALLIESMQKLGIAPAGRVLEIGCGGGWTSEFLAQMGFHVVGTTIHPLDIEEGKQRAASHAIRNIKTDLNYVCATMEEVYQATAEFGPFDMVFVHEALHHAYDWRIACENAYQCLKPGGWFLLLNEPNLVHTLVAYRFSQLSKSPEIGFRKGEVFRFLKQIGFGKRVVLAKRLGFFCRGIWVAVQRPPQ